MRSNDVWVRTGLSVFWMAVSMGAAIGMTMEGIRMARNPDLPLPAILGTLPFFLAALAAGLTGWGLLKRRRWARPVAIVLSTLVLLWGLPALLLIGIEQGLLPMLLVALVVLGAAYSLWFAAGRMDQRGD